MGDGQYNLVAPPVPPLPEEETELLSLSTSLWGNDIAQFESFDFEVPENVNVVKINYVFTSTSNLVDDIGMIRSEAWVWGHQRYIGTASPTIGEIFVKVTPGKSYTWYVGCAGSGKQDTTADVKLSIVYSKSINETSVDYSDL